MDVERGLGLMKGRRVKMMTRATLALAAAAAMMLGGLSTAEASTPDYRPGPIIARAAHRLPCDVVGPAEFDGPFHYGAICWRDLENLNGKTYLLRYRNGDRAERYWHHFLGGQGCVARRGRLFVLAGDPWYECGAARHAARRLGGHVIR